ncbi:MAG: choice-of-anchor J domain-containing protein [Cyclobacteriaceae bacterium]|nr:choice-of-anchor J domain-containing protein [Cyclobacteriaceae bacterium]
MFTRGLVFFFLLTSFAGAAQTSRPPLLERCGTTKYETLQLQLNPNRERNTQFENWMQQKLTTKRFENQRTHGTQTSYTIPVVVHIIHNGEPIGTGTNISNNQVLSQINAMNKDYQRLNSDAANTPVEFQSVAGSFDIEFVLAKQDPFGAPTNGINRVQGTKTVWTINDNATFKALSYWPAEDYLNIWVINIPSYLGFAQFPISSLPGLEDSSNDRLTDGVVIDYSVFGSNFEGLGTFNLDTKYNRGRTCTHEVGHFFGLKHIWGDDGSACTGTDYVDDTPNQGGNYVGQCPTGTRNSCSSNDMYMNYMDYTDDACMNLYTQGQVARMTVVVENSPRRFSLLNSNGANDPPPLANDLAITQLNAPAPGFCGGVFTPMLTVQNIGTSTVITARVQLKVNNTVVETKDFTPNLVNLATTTFTFNPLTQNSGTVNYAFEVLLVNGVTDQRPDNSLRTVSTTVPVNATLPLAEVFNSIPSNWKIYNPDGGVQWSLRNTPTNGNAMYVNCYDYEIEGAIDRLITPMLDLTTASTAYLRFDRAYALFSASYPERLRVLVSTTCDFTNTFTEVLNLEGSALATAPATTSSFVPANSAQWQNTTVSLQDFIGNKIQVAFEVTNAYGNNVYIDNITISTDNSTDIALLAIESPGPVTCVAQPAPVIRVKNMGSVTIQSFNVQPQLNGIVLATQAFSNQNINPGGEATFTLAALPYTTGHNSLTLTVTDPNGLFDSTPDNNVVSLHSIINNRQQTIPLRENFDGAFDDWSVISQGQADVWSSLATNKVSSLAYQAFTNPNRGEETWLATPVLDFSRTNKASVFFDVSYATQNNGNERLRVLASTDCGQTYPITLYDQAGESLSSVASTTNWIPSANGDWNRESIILNALVGNTQTRLAFVATADNGNNLFIDNIEFFISDNITPLNIDDAFKVYGSGTQVFVTFNLAEKSNALLRIYNAVGQLVLSNHLSEVLNQTYEVTLNQGSGIYIVQVQAGNLLGAERVWLSNR